MNKLLAALLVLNIGFMGFNLYERNVPQAHAQMSQSSLKGRLVTEIGAIITVADATQLANWSDAVAKAVVDEITTNAIVVVPGGSSAGSYPVQ